MLVGNRAGARFRRLRNVADAEAQRPIAQVTTSTYSARTNECRPRSASSGFSRDAFVEEASMQASGCRLCLGSDVFDTGLRALDHEHGGLHRVFECRECTGRFISDIPPLIEKVQEERVDAFDRPARHEAQRAYFAGKKVADEHDYPYSLIPLVRQYSSGNRVLDLGCGGSQFLPLIKQLGYEATGFEGDPVNVQIAREQRVEVLSGDWSRIGECFGGRRFNCIVSDQVFEHMLDPIGTLEALSAILAPDGVLIFRFPNEGSMRRRVELAWCRLKGNTQPMSYFVDHWNYFNERAARWTFASAGYEVLRVKKDLSLHGYLARKLFDPLSAHPGAARLVARTIAKVDTNLLSNGLTVVARRTTAH
jgi:SAM-dependent methyltransferase